MYLSRLTFNARDRAARAWLADCNALHRVIMSGFPAVETEAARAGLAVLYRVELMKEPPSIPVLVQSRTEPRWTLETDAVEVAPPRSLDAVLARVEDGQRYRFRLRANPTRRVHTRASLETGPESPRQRAEKPESVGKRVDLRREEDQLAWLARRAQASGFSLLTNRLVPADREVLATQADAGSLVRGWSRNLTFGTVLFEGTLQVTETGRFREGIIGGIGPAKAFGCGLLSIAPVASP